MPDTTIVYMDEQRGFDFTGYHFENNIRTAYDFEDNHNRARRPQTNLRSK